MRTSSSAFLCRKLWGPPSASPTSCICILSSWFWVSLHITRLMNPWRNVQMSAVGFWYQPFGFVSLSLFPPFQDYSSTSVISTSRGRGVSAPRRGKLIEIQHIGIQHQQNSSSRLLPVHFWRNIFWNYPHLPCANFLLLWRMYFLFCHQFTFPKMFSFMVTVSLTGDLSSYISAWIV